MRNQRALAAACTAAAVLGLAAPVAVADGMGNGGGTTGGTGTGTIVGPGTGVGNFGNGNGNFGGGGGGGNFPGGGNGNFNGNGGFSGNGRFEGHFNGTISGNGRISSNGRGDEFGNGERGRGNGRGDEFGGPGDNGLGGDFGNRPGGDNGLRDIVVTPGVVAAGGRLTVTVHGCRGGQMASRAFRTAPLTPFRDDTSRGVVYVNRDARPGRYDITVRCERHTQTRPRAFTVIGGVNGGLGGSRTSGATTADMAIGGALVGVAVIGGGVYWLRRRGERRA
ncbi:hypothetical protein [Streptomyces sp. F-1]|uniref:hypothetical protein n=1 Tax=Streptomyces sp. F-1 TaxID=463642 RepID=UPI00085C1575|nr:hypothetical protein [Streptomyces sp. F-1]SFY53956.1 hypothetical protein STEPF1_07248 [Streptomyces sp. F-1]